MRVFPVDQSARPTFSDDWGQPRSGGRSHEGTDIFAPEGTPVLAVDDGVADAWSSDLGGLNVTLRSRDGSRYHYGHLSAYEGSFPRSPKAGECIGYVGRTGNAAGTAPHLHFEWRPGGGDKANPYPMLASLARPGHALQVPVTGRAAPAGGGAALLLMLLLWRLSR